jgi:hypothetical protein
MKQTPFKSSVNFGAMYGLACFAMFLLIYWAGKNPLGPASWLAVWIPPLFIVLSIRYYRNNILGGTITFGEALRAGLITVLSGAMLYSLFVVIFGKLIDPEMIDSLKEQLLTELETMEAMVKNMMGDAMYENSIEEIKGMTLGRQAFSEFLNKSLSGLVYSLIAAAALKRKPQNIV